MIHYAEHEDPPAFPTSDIYIYIIFPQCGEKMPLFYAAKLLNTLTKNTGEGGFLGISKKHLILYKFLIRMFILI